MLNFLKNTAITFPTYLYANINLNSFVRIFFFFFFSFYYSQFIFCHFSLLFVFSYLFPILFLYFQNSQIKKKTFIYKARIGKIRCYISLVKKKPQHQEKILSFVYATHAKSRFNASFCTLYIYNIHLY